jgi:hypothetical protein
MNYNEFSYQGQTLKRIQKRTAIKLYNDHKGIFLTGDKYIPGSHVNIPILINKYDNDTQEETEFKQQISAFSYYNHDIISKCIHFYIIKR